MDVSKRMSKKYRSNRGLKKRCDCARRTWETCDHPWFFNFTWQGRSERGSLDVAARVDALKKFADIKAAMMNGGYVKAKHKAAPAALAEPTLATVAGCYLEQHVEVRLSAGAAAHHETVMKFLAQVTVPPGIPIIDKPFRLITQEDIEMVLAAKRERRPTTVTRGDSAWTRLGGGHVAANRMHAHLGALWNWAIQPKRAYAERTPFSHAGRVPDELRKPKERSRDRRLEQGEEVALLAHAGPHLRDCIVGALETGMRKTEILSLRWRDIRWLQNEIAIEWSNTKTKQARRIPISATLRELLVRRQQAHPKDTPWTPENYVFGDGVGGRVLDIRTAWDTAVLRAHGVQVRGSQGRMSAESREHLRRIDLNFHDLRHEAGSRKLEEGWPLHAVSRWLGHTKLTTTDTYLHATTKLLHDLNERVPLVLVKG